MNDVDFLHKRIAHQDKEIENYQKIVARQNEEIVDLNLALRDINLENSMLKRKLDIP